MYLAKRVADYTVDHRRAELLEQFARGEAGA